MSQALQVLPADDSQEDLWSGLEIHDSAFTADRHRNVRPMPIRSQTSQRPSFSLKSASSLAHATDMAPLSQNVNEVTPSHSLSTSFGSTSSVESSTQSSIRSTLNVGKANRTRSLSKGRNSSPESKGTSGEPTSPRVGSAIRRKTDREGVGARYTAHASRPARKSEASHRQSGSGQHLLNVQKLSKPLVHEIVSKDSNVHRMKSTDSLARRGRSSTTVRKRVSVPALSPQVSRASNRTSSVVSPSKRSLLASMSTEPTGHTSLQTKQLVRKLKSTRLFGDGTELDDVGEPAALDEEHIMSGESMSIKSSTPVRSMLWSHAGCSSSSVGSEHFSEDFEDQECRQRERNPRRPVLIQDPNLRKHYQGGEAVCNSCQERPNTDDLALVDFDKSPPTAGPMLISPSSPSKTFQLIGNMMFDPEKMQWVNLSGTADEDDIFDHCDSDSDSEWSLGSQPGASNAANADHRGGISSATNDFLVGKEFDITSSFLEVMLAAERQHGNEMSRWYPGPVQPLKNEQRFGLRDSDLKRGYLYDIRKMPKSHTLPMHSHTGHGG